MVLKKSYPILKDTNIEECLNVKDSTATSLGAYTLAESKKDSIESFKAFYKFEEVTLTCQTVAIHGSNFYPNTTAKLTKFSDHAGFLRLEFSSAISNANIWDTLSFRDGNNNSYTFMSLSWYCPLEGSPQTSQIWNNEFYAYSEYTSVSPCVISLFVTF